MQYNQNQCNTSNKQSSLAYCVYLAIQNIKTSPMIHNNSIANVIIR